MKKVGIIGGLGPETTAEFYLQIIQNVMDSGVLARPEILINSVPMDLAVEESFINGADQSAAYLKALTEAAQALERAGADFLVIPCNTVHIFIEDVRRAVAIPVLSIVEETARFLETQKIQKVGLLATKNTRQTNLYGQPVEEKRIEVFYPADEDQEKVGALITRLVHGERAQKDTAELEKIIEALALLGADAVLLACTDLQLVVPEQTGVPVFDTMRILADATSEVIIE